MYSRLRSVVCVGALAAGALFGAGPAHAGVILQDNYDGGRDTWNSPSDVIGDTNVFQISDAVIQRINNGNTLEITIDTNFAGAPEALTSDGTGYGALFITPTDQWNPYGSAGDNYINDYVGNTGTTWEYAATIPVDPGSSIGSGWLYSTSDGSIILSNVPGCSGTYPLDPSCGWYFRQDQPVQFQPNSVLHMPSYSETWAIDAVLGTITFYINDNDLLGDDFALSWAMTCANDVIQGQVSLTLTNGGLTSVPEPPTYSLLLAGFLFAGAFRTWRMRKQV
jgi:PEP-CTERM motif